MAWYGNVQIQVSQETGNGLALAFERGSGERKWDSRGGPYAREDEERDTVEVHERVRGSEHARERETDVEGDVRRRSEEREHEEPERLPRWRQRSLLKRGAGEGARADADGAQAKALTKSELIVPSSTSCVLTIALPRSAQKVAATNPACMAVIAVSAVEPCSRKEPVERS